MIKLNNNLIDMETLKAKGVETKITFETEI